jgi:hypothetical protein
MSEDDKQRSLGKLPAEYAKARQDFIAIKSEALRTADHYIKIGLNLRFRAGQEKQDPGPMPDLSKVKSPDSAFDLEQDFIVAQKALAELIARMRSAGIPVQDES